MDSSSLPAIEHLDVPEPAPRAHQWIYIVVTSAIAAVLLMALTLYFSANELHASGTSAAEALIQTPTIMQADLGDIARRALAQTHGVRRVEACRGLECASAEAPSEAHLSLDRWFAKSCGHAEWMEDEQTIKVTVCMSTDEVVEDIVRDTLVLLLAQGIGLAIWTTTQRAHHARTRRWQERLHRLAASDAATGLLNRAGFTGVLHERLGQAHSQWLVLVGVDGLKAINDLHGHSVGDEVIQRVARRLMKVFQVQGTLARTGGDEFALLLPASLDEPLTEWLMSLRESMAVPIIIDSLRLLPSVSVGVALLDHAGSASEALRMGHVALQGAKRAGPSGMNIFDPSQDREARRLHALKRDLVEAVQAGTLDVLYQPVVDTRGEVVAAEALARWRHPKHGPIPPDVFIPLAEASGCVQQLGLLVMRKACADLAALRAQQLPIQRIAVNLSPHQLNEPDLAATLRATVEAAGLRTGDIELELTESAAMKETGRVRASLAELAACGFSIAIDDFGTGHSSLSRLQRLPVHKLKIDKSFVAAGHTASGAVILDTMLTMASRLRLTTVCEGVETREQFEALKAGGCDLFQGYHFGKPMPVDELGALVRRGGLMSEHPEAA